MSAEARSGRPRRRGTGGRPEPGVAHGSRRDARAAIELRGVHQRFGEVVALVDVNFTIDRHERVGIVGPSGCGKSTLLSDDRRADRARQGDDRDRGRDHAARSACRRAPSCRSATSCCRGGPPSTTPPSPWRTEGSARRGRARASAAALRTVRSRRVRGADAGGALRGDAPARRVPAHADGREGRPPARRAVRRARLDHPRRDAGVAADGPASRSRGRWCSSRTTSTRRSCSRSASW